MLKVFEAFSGVGSQRMALQNIGVEHEVVAIAEIDKFAIASYEAIHGDTFNVGDISQLQPEDIPDHDLFTYSFPCQDISVAGKQSGFKKSSGTRSSLLWECNRVIESKKPKYLLLENVKNLVGKKFKPDFDEWLNHLESLGYKNYWQTLNAKDYGIPQNRERVFVVSILGEHEPYKFPEPVKLELRLKDILESEVDEKFYLDEEKVDKLIINSDKLAIGYIPRTNGTQHQSNTIYKTDAESPSMQARDYKDPVKILIKNATKKGYLEATDGDGIDLAYPNSQTRRGRVQKESSPTLQTADSVGVVELPVIAASRGRNPENPSDRTVGSPAEQRLEINNKGVSNTLTTVQKDNYVVEIDSKECFGRMGKQAAETYNKYLPDHASTINPFNETISSTNGISPTITTRPEGFKTAITIVDYFRIRKLTPLECWRLMGFKDLHFYKAQEVNSNSQLYKQAGNSIVVQVLEAIFKELI